MKMQKRYVENAGELTEKEIIRAERNAGFISDRVRDIQLLNAQRKREQKERRERDLREGLQLYRGGKYEEALEKFESVLGSQPDATEASIASYNVACCYSKLNQIQAGLSALEVALKDGSNATANRPSEDSFPRNAHAPTHCFPSQRIRSDRDLENVTNSEEFDPLLKKYDESFINENAIKSLFGFNKK